MTTLIVDDHAPNLKLLRFVLESEGHEVREACNGVEALRILDLQKVDIIVSDILMPRMDGYRLCDAVRQDPRYKELPFVFYTATYTSEGDEKLCLELGADRFLRKPVAPDVLLATVRELTEGKTRTERAYPPLENSGILKEYNERLSAKLDEKNLAIERTNYELRASEERYHGTMDAMLEGAQIIGFDWRYTYLNDAAAWHGRRRKEELLGRTIQECFPGIEQTAIFKAMAHCMATRQGTRVENEFTYPEGGKAWFEIRIQPAPEGIFILSLDISDRKQALQRLRESEERFRQLADNIDEVFWMTDPAAGKVLYASPAFAAIWGESEDSLYVNASIWSETAHPEDRDRVAQYLRRTRPFNETFRLVTRDGTQRWILNKGFPVRNEAGEVYRMVGIAKDISERKSAELRTDVQHQVTAVLAEGRPLLETSNRILAIICHSLEWDMGDVWIVDRASKVLRCLEIHHPDSTEFKLFADVSRRLVFAPGEGLPGAVWQTNEPQWIADVSSNPNFPRRTVAAKVGVKGALAFPIKLRGEVYGVVGVYSRQSRTPDSQMWPLFNALGTQIGQFIERKQLEDQYRQAQKMEAIGTLAGGIAHDFNNVLGAIRGYTDLARLRVTDPEVRDYLTAVTEGTTRAADLVRQILAFSRRQEQQRKPLQLSPIVDEALRLLRATIPATIQFDVSFGRNLPTVLADSTQIHQLVVNLVTNAAHAMKDRPGRLGVTLETVQVLADLVAVTPGLRTGPHVLLTVTDNGHGMDAATLSRIFDPFFTTKGPGEGSGLGLPVVHGIMQSHEGAIKVYSQPGDGARFQLYFPAYSGNEAVAASTPTGTDATELPLGEGQRIMVVDDEAILAMVCKAALQKIGYTADSYTDPAEALAVLREGRQTYDLVITDLTMPEITGTELARHVLSLNPRMPIVLTTGYSATLTLDGVRALGIKDMILKPVAIQRLAEVVHRLLKSNRS